MTYEKIINTIITELQGVFDAMPQPEDGNQEDYKIIVCPERIFVDDYAVAEQEYVNSLTNRPELFGDEPNNSPYRKIIFVVVKLGTGQENMAVSNYSINIQVLSEENDFLFSRDLLDNFVSEYNFEYKDNILHSYFPPEMNSSQDSVYIGFRALFSLRGFIRVPNDGFLFAKDITVSWSDGETEYSGKIPFINLSYHYSAQPDPQAFAGYLGQTKAMNRQNTETVTFVTYLMCDDEATDAPTVLYTSFTKAVLNAKSKMNRNFFITISTPSDGTTLTSTNYKLVGVDYSQDIANISPIALSFVCASEDE